MATATLLLTPTPRLARAQRHHLATQAASSGQYSWESRFKCQVLLEPPAALSCMAYVDLNPVRAAMCDTLIDSDYTSIQRRLRERGGILERANPDRSILDRPLKPVAGLDADGLLEMTEASYIDIVQWTGEQVHSDKRGALRPP